MTDFEVVFLSVIGSELTFLRDPQAIIGQAFCRNNNIKGNRIRQNSLLQNRYTRFGAKFIQAGSFHFGWSEKCFFKMTVYCTSSITIKLNIKFQKYYNFLCIFSDLW